MRTAALAGVSPQDVRRGLSELSLPELRRQVRLVETSTTPAGFYVRSVQLSYYERVPFAYSTLVLALFMLAASSTWSLRRWQRLLCALAALLGYFVVMYWGRRFGLRGELPAVAASWLPLGVFAAMGVAIDAAGAVRRRRLASTSPSP